MTLDSLVPEDFLEFPVWEYLLSGGVLGGESTVEEVRDSVITHFTNRIVGTQVTLNNSIVEFCILGNLDLHNPTSNEHFLIASFFRNGKWFHLSRYHDADFSRHGPDQLASFLGYHVDSVFPITYCLSNIKNLSVVLKGTIYKAQPFQMSEDELIQLALSSS